MKQGIQANIDTMTQAEKAMLRYNYILTQTREVMGDFNRTSDSWHNQLTITKNLFVELQKTMGTAFVNMLKPMLMGFNQALIMVNNFAEKVVNSLGAIFGWKVKIEHGGILSDDGMSEFTDATDNATGSVKKLNRQLQGFHELNVLTTQDKGGSGAMTGFEGYGDALAESKVIIEETESIFESEWDTLYKLGKGIGDSITKGLKDIDWNSAYQSAKNFGTGLADFLNGLISPELFYETGKTIAKSLGTAFTSVNAFATNFDWDNFGKSFGDGINGYFKNNDIALQVETVLKIVNGIITSLSTAVNTVKWDEVGKQIGKAINKIDFSELGINLANLAISILKAIGKAITGLGKENPLASAIVSALLAIKFGSTLMSLGNTVLTAIGSSIGCSTVAIPIPSTTAGPLGIFCTTLGKAIGGAVAAAAAWTLGWDLGEWAYNNLPGVKKFVDTGIKLADDIFGFTDVEVPDYEVKSMERGATDFDDRFKNYTESLQLKITYDTETYAMAEYKAKEDIKKWGDTIAKAVKSEDSSIKKAFKSFGNTITKSLPSNVRTALNKISSSDTVASAKNNVKSLLGEIGNTLLGEDSLKKWQEGGEAIPTNVNKGIANGNWNSAKATTASKAKELKQTFSNEDWRGAGVGASKAIDNGISDSAVWSGATTKIQNNANTVIGAYKGRDWKGAGQYSVEVLSSGLTSSTKWSTMGQYVKDKASVLSSDFGNSNNWKKNASNIPGLMSSGLDFSEVSKKVNNNRDTISSNFAKGNWKSDASKVPQIIKDGMDLNWSTIATNITADWNTSGSNLVGGLKKGIKTTWQSKTKNGLLSTITDLATKLTGALNDAFGINSPSKVWAESGYWLDMGLAKGIADDIPTIENTVSELAYAMNNKLNSAMEPMNASLSSGFGIDDVNVVGNISKEFNASLNTTSSEQNALLRQQNELLLQILQKEGITASDVFDAVRQQNRNYYNQTGKNAFAF